MSDHTEHWESLLYAARLLVNAHCPEATVSVRADALVEVNDAREAKIRELCGALEQIVRLVEFIEEKSIVTEMIRNVAQAAAEGRLTEYEQSLYDALDKPVAEGRG